MENNRKFDLEDRLIDFAVLIIDITEIMINSRASSILKNQMLRSGTSPALNYGEVQSSESRRDFIHKISLILKELRETRVCLKIIDKKEYCKSKVKVNAGLSECNELIAIFVKSKKTAKGNISKE